MEDNRGTILRPHFRDLHNDRSNPGLDLSLWMIAIAHYHDSAIVQFSANKCGHLLVQLSLNGLLEQSFDTATNELAQRVETGDWTLQINNVILFYSGVSFGLMGCFGDNQSTRYAALIPALQTPDLVMTLANLMMLAFLIDQVQALCCPRFRAAQEKEEQRCYFWHNIRLQFYGWLQPDWETLHGSIAYGYKEQIQKVKVNTS